MGNLVSGKIPQGEIPQQLTDYDFRGKKIIVTDAGRGIGLALVSELHSRGATVYAVSRHMNLKYLEAELPNVIPICVDLANWYETRRLLGKLERVDCLINNAPMNDPADFLEISSELFDLHFNVNLKSIINVSQVVARKMIKSGKGGTIVNISPLAEKTALAGSGIYCCTKASIEILTKVMANEFGPYKITVNSVNPAAVVADYLDWVTVKDIEASNNEPNNNGKYSKCNNKLSKCNNLIANEINEKKSISKVPTIHSTDIVNAVLFFASGITKKITGENLSVDAGLLISQ